MCLIEQIEKYLYTLHNFLCFAQRLQNRQWEKQKESNGKVSTEKKLFFFTKHILSKAQAVTALAGKSYSYVVLSKYPWFRHFLFSLFVFSIPFVGFIKNFGALERNQMFADRILLKFEHKQTQMIRFQLSSIFLYFEISMLFCLFIYRSEN